MPKLFPNTPYFDDYNEDKLFQQILFKPGKAVQARELTQLQTLSQKQIERVGNHIFKNGSIVTNCNFALDLKLPYLKIQDNDISSNSVDITDIEAGFTLTGLASGVSGYVVTTADGLQAVTNTKTIFFKYTSANETTKTFSNGEQVQVRDANGNLVVTVVALSSNATGNGSSFTLGEGIVYLNGMFLKHLGQTIILDRYSVFPSYKLGIRLNETVITSEADETLLDPALGSSNYFASGADRYKAETVLTKVALDDEEPSEFFLLYEVENGVEKRSLQKSQYNELLDALAERTYDESGDYTVKPFSLRIREHLDTGTNNGLYYANTNPLFTGNVSGNAELLVVGIEPGTAYVKGYKVENKITEYLTIDKGTEFTAEEAQPISFGYGNYILCNELSGLFDVDNGSSVSLRSSAADAVTNKTYGATSAPGSQIGTARVRSVEFETGNIGLADGEYRVYLYDVRMNTGQSFSNVRSVTQSSTSSLADVKLTSGSAQLQETNFNTGVFRFPQKSIKRLRAVDGSIDNSYEFKKSFSVTISQSGTFSITSSVENEEFPFGLGELNATQKRDNFVLVLDQSGTTANLPGTITTSTSGNSILGSTTTFNTTFKPGDILKTAGANSYRIANVKSDTELYIVDSTASANESSVNYQKVFTKGEFIDLSETGSSGSTRSVDITSDTEAQVDIEETLATGTTLSARVLVNLQKTDGQEIQKTLRKNRFVRISCDPDTSGSYNLGFSDVYRIVGIYHGSDYSESNTDVTNQFTLDNGQRDNFYTHGRIVKKAGSTLTLTTSSRLLVKLDYFFHDTSSGVGYFSVDSYPIDDTETLANTIKTENIPIFTSPSTGISYDLRDCIDIRPRFTDTASDATIAGDGTENPSAPSGSSSFLVPSGGLRVPAPNQEFNTDLEYYLSRIDRVYIDKSNRFGVVRGLPGVFPNPPEEPAVGMSIGLVTIPPYPSLAPQPAKNANRFDYMVTTKLLDNRRYTMKDIGAINQRISRLEYYTALSFLEKKAEDLVIPSSVTGLDRFKNGFLVDSFNGHGVGNVYDPNYKIAVDPTKQELRPYFLIDNLDFEFDAAQSSNYLRAPRDATITLTSVSGTFVRGQTITQSSVTATVDHFVGAKLYVSNTTGTFSISASISTAGGASAVVSDVKVPNESDIVTAPYSHAVYAQNPFATRPRNCVGDLLFNYVGEIDLNPPGDNWTDTRTNPDLVVNFDNNLDNWLALEEAWGTQWDDWNTDWGGWSTTDQVIAGATSVRGTSVVQNQQTINVRERTGTQTRSGTQLNVTPETVTYNLGNRLVNTNLATFMRSQLITFNAVRLKPNTRVYPYFDGEPVSEYCRPLGGSYGGALITDSTGGLVGQFQIPNNDSIRFRVGQRLFRLTDDAENRPRFSTTSATSEYTSFGIQQTQETTILSTRQARLAVTSVSDNRTVSQQRVSVSEPTERVVGQVPVIVVNSGGDGGGDGGSDPIAQTFIVEKTGFGMFLSKIDLFFRTKHPTLPITLQIREVINGTIGPRILPFGSVTMFPDDINVSEDASAATPFIFPAPVHLQDGVEYCFVAIPAGDNPGYNIWVSELGENQVGTSTRVSEQPYIGVLFTSANNRTWTPFQAEDIKFTLYRANFNTDVTTTAVLSNDDSDYLAVTNLSGGTFGVGDNVQYSSGVAIVKEYDNINNVVVLKKYGNARINPSIESTGTINCNVYSNVVVGDGTLFTTQAFANAMIYSSNITTRLGNVARVIDDTTLWLKENASANCESNVVIIYDELRNISNVGISATVETVNEKFITLFDTNLQFINFIVTNDEWSYKIRDASSNAVSSSYIKFLLNENTELSSEAKVSSNSTEDRLFSNTKSMSVKVDFSTTSPYVSPVLDLFKPSAIVVRNQINNDDTNETTNQGNALSRYISKQVILDEGQDAEDLKVYLTGYKPGSTDIKVYARIANANDGSPFSEIDYIELEKVTSSIVVSSSKNDQDFKEYEYRFPSTVLTGPNGEVQYTSPDGKVYTGYKYFAIKIVLLSPNKAIVPKVKDYRAIALQI